MNLFLDTSILLSAANSRTGASLAIFGLAHANNWHLLVSPWVLAEVKKNLIKFSDDASKEWATLRKQMLVVPDIVSMDRPLVFTVSKDRPILITALAYAHVLLTLDRQDFIGLLGDSCYGMPILLPGRFLRVERDEGRLISRP